MSARSELKALLTAPGALPADVALLDYASQIDPPARSTVMVRLDEVRPHPVEGIRTYAFTLILLAAKVATGPADDELEALLEDVLLAISKPSGLAWEKAARGVYAESTPAFEVPLTVTVSAT